MLNRDWHANPKRIRGYSTTARLASNLPDVSSDERLGRLVPPPPPSVKVIDMAFLAVSPSAAELSSGATGMAHLTTPMIALLTQRIQQEFDEAPGLKLTVVEGVRFWSLDANTCADVLERLLQRGFLVRTADGRYQRAPMT
jgi:hypothetical protein